MQAPNESAFRGRILAWKSLAFSKTAPVEERTIPAEWLRALLRSHNEVLTVPLEISNALIEGDLDLGHCVFERRLSLTSCDFSGQVNLSHTEVRGHTCFDDSTFTALTMTGAALSSDFRFKGVGSRDA